MSGRYGWAVGCVVPIALLVGLCAVAGIEGMTHDPAPLVRTVAKDPNPATDATNTLPTDPAGRSRPSPPFTNPPCFCLTGAPRRIEWKNHSARAAEARRC